MKFSTFACALLALFLISLRVQAQMQAQPEDYEYLRRISVPDVVINCVAALDEWVRQGQRYDSLLVPDRRALTARIETPAPDGAITRVSSSGAVAQASPIDKLVHLRGFAKVRGKYAWVPVKATCGVWHSRIVDVALKPRQAHADSPIQ
ncbi:Lipoprotein [Paraburkholderia sacchari]|uniref:BspC domain-containing protein n=1 Tax=Paraburkholderia sacchari TaxID=159450 RepID=UPI0039A4382F